MTIAAATLAYYGREAERIARGPQVYGGNAQVATLRCFIRYHRDARQEVTIAGKLRYLTHLQVATLGLVSRLAVTSEHATIRSMSHELHCAPSTVSRSMLKFQAWGGYAIDVTRGRYGGVTVRARTTGDALKVYADRAWERIKRAALNVASRISRKEEGFVDPENVEELCQRTYYFEDTYMDATLTEAWDAAEARRERLRREHGDPEQETGLPARMGDGHQAPDQRTREDFASAVLAERRRLAIIDPAGEAEAVRPLW